MKYILLLLITLTLNAQNDFSVRVLYGTATDKALGDILIGDFGSYPESLSVSAFDAGYLLNKDTFDLPINIYVKAGLGQFNEGSYSNVNELVLYVKAVYSLDFLDNRIRFGLGEGFSYTSDILRVEQFEADTTTDGKTSQFLNYLDITVDFDFGRLIRYAPLHDTYIGVALKHRSGVFGLVNGVTKGGSNYNSIYLEKNF
ncbi:hypothetical protein JHD46_01230 [Sulfurimonas sp. SAG-AH-194-C20]|nr:hypothetical protein [Sulfurimonas sp. SAG-AH-194-C20]MDF1878255.1 hypothetical protein [Sulfurimonas sp. SAG-AH-194-C20]